MDGSNEPGKSSNVGRVFGVVLVFWLAAAIVFALSGGLFRYSDPTSTTPVWQALTVVLLVAGLVAGIVATFRWR